MKFSSVILILSLAAAAGCMNNEPVASQPRGAATSPEIAAATGQAAVTPAAPASDATTVARTSTGFQRADKLIGETVLTSDGMHSGKIDDFVVDQASGKILYAIVGLGGLLGVGETRVAVPPALLIDARKGSVQLSVDKSKLARAPQVSRELDKNGNEQFLSNVYGYYGQASVWQHPTAGTSASLNSVRRVSELDGMKVINNAHQDIGKIESVVLDVPRGREVYMVISPSSGLNLGNNYYALPPAALKVTTEEKTLVSDVTREKLAGAPHFTKEAWPELSDPVWGQKLYQYYDQPAPLQSGDLQPTGRNLQPAPVYPKR